MVTEEEKIIICCNLLGGTLRGLEELARLSMCCNGSKVSKVLAREAIQIAEIANDDLGDILSKLTKLKD